MSRIELARHLAILCMLYISSIAVGVGASSVDLHDDEGEEEEVEPAFATLFPPFTLTVGVLAFYFLTRYIKALPYTAVSGTHVF